MIDTIFLQIYDMSRIAGLVILAVLLVRLCLKRAPKVFSYALWAVVLFRLLCPFSIEAPVSLIPQTEPTIESYDLLNESVTPFAAMDAAQQVVGDVLNGGVGIQHVKTTEFEEDGSMRIISTDWWNVWILFIRHIWLIGMAALLVYSTILLIRLKRRLICSVCLRDNIYLADGITSPFVLGLLRPKIYLPSSLSGNEREYILLHEQHHIRRGDHIIKLLSFAALCLHWFNPLVWIAFILSGKDMEMSCDEAVLRKLGGDIRADYSASLVSLATGRRIIAGTPLAFGEGDTMGRIRNIAKWKKPAIWVIAAAVIACVVLAVCLITNPISRDTMLLGAEYRIAEQLYETPSQRSFLADNDLPSFCITADYCLWEREAEGEFILTGQMEPYTLNKEELTRYTAYEDGWHRKYRIGDITDSYILHLPGSESEGWMYIAFRTSRGDTLLGFGREDISERGDPYSDDSGFMWLYRLESIFGDTHLSGEFHERSLAQTIGGDVEIFHTHYDERHPNYMVVGFKSDESPYMDGIQLPSPEKTDMGFAVFYCNKDESGYRLIQCHVYEDAALAENGIYLCPDPAVLDLDGEMKLDMTYDVILINNDRIEKVTRIWEYADGRTKTESQGYLSGHEMVLFSWKNDKAGCCIWQYFYDEQGELMDYSSITKYQVASNLRVWVDYFSSPGKMEWDIVQQTEIFDYPDVTFSYTSEKITAEDKYGTTELVFGMPIWNAFFSDLNGDGYAEICATVSFGSGIIDTHVVVYDYRNRTQHTLWERGVTEYALRELNGQMVCDKWAYPDSEEKECGYLAINDGELHWISKIDDMIPTTANVSGAFDSYLYVSLNGANYRYERTDGDSASVIKGELLYTFTEKAEPDDVEWRVYAVDDYPDHSAVLAEAGEDYVHLYRYSPPKAVDPDRLTAAKASGTITLEDGYATFGQELWDTFYRKTQDGKSASVKVAHYHTLENGNYDPTYYEVYREDYPAMYTFDLSYDGEFYTLTWEDSDTEYVRVYRYLRVFEDTVPTVYSSREPEKVTRYVLTNDKTASLTELWYGVASSQLGDFIDFYTIYSIKN